MTFLRKKKVTPLYDKSWFVKWISSFFLIAAIIFRTTNQNTFDIYFSLIGVFGWFLVGMWWHDRSLILLNGIAVALLITGLF
tara:strand:+ start:1600 stop:1845 length:246 start_codon:yes stop_codon:yes gene_type:complete